MNVSLESQELDTTKITSAEFILLISFTRKSYFPRFVRCQMITLLYSTLHLDPLVLTRHVFVGLIQTLILTT